MASKAKKEKRAREATYAWAGLAAYILAYDAYALKKNKQTLSKGFTNGMATWKGRVALVLIWAAITKHLVFSKFHPEFDIIGLAANKVSERWGVVELISKEIEGGLS